MRRLRRFGSALLLGALAALGVAERVALHGHPLEENDLVPHSIVVVDRDDGCDRRPHLDSGAIADHPVCVECVLAASAIAVAPSTLSRFADSAGRSLLALPAVTLPASGSARDAGARGPPRT
jgi:hypothetical protein